MGGSGVATLGLPDSPGVPSAATKAIFEENKDEIAAVILEPVVGNSGFIKPDKAFLQEIREMCDANGALLVFDEVMTGFRVSYGGAQEYFGVTPDVTTMGKVIGGGLPVGAYGGRKDIMEMVAPAGPMYQAGTLSGNPLAMISGIKTMERLEQPGSYEHLDKVTSKLIKGILEAAKEAGHAVCGGSISAMFGFFFCEGPVTCFADATKSDTDKFARWHAKMLERGIYLAPSQRGIRGDLTSPSTDFQVFFNPAPSTWKAAQSEKRFNDDACCKCPGGLCRRTGRRFDGFALVGCSEARAGEK